MAAPEDCSTEGRVAGTFERYHDELRRSDDGGIWRMRSDEMVGDESC
jgi:hypothetical protein